MIDRVFLSRTLLTVCWALWVPGVALAAVLDYNSEFHSVGFVALVANIGIATLSGLTALLQRIRSELAAGNGRLSNPAMFCAANLVGSVMAGLVGFLISRASNTGNAWTEMLLVATFAFVGARAIEAVAERVLITVAPNVRVGDEKPDQ